MDTFEGIDAFEDEALHRQRSKMEWLKPGWTHGA